MGTTASATVLSNLYQISTFTELQITLETYSFDPSIFRTHRFNHTILTIGQSRETRTNKWVMRLQWLSWAFYTIYLPPLSSRWLSRLTVFTWIPSYEARSNQTVLTAGQIRKNFVKWVLRPQRLSWAVCTRYLLLLSFRLLSRLTALNWIPS